MIKKKLIGFLFGVFSLSLISGVLPIDSIKLLL